MIHLLFPCFCPVHDPWVHSERCFCHHLGSSLVVITNSVISLKIPIFLSVPKISMIPLQRKQLSFRVALSTAREHCTPKLMALSCSKVQKQSVWSRQKEELPREDVQKWTVSRLASCLPASTFCRWGCQSWKSIYVHAFGAIWQQPAFYHCICIINKNFPFELLGHPLWILWLQVTLRAFTHTCRQNYI